MILAACLAVEGECDSPPDLLYWLDYRQFKVLPRDGGLDDQVYGQLTKMMAVGHAYTIWGIRKYQGRRYRELTTEDWKLIIAIQKYIDGLDDDAIEKVNIRYHRDLRR